MLLALGAGDERVPGHPGIDLAVLEGGSAVGRGQVGGLDIAEAQASLGQCSDQQVVAAGGLGHGDALALEIGQGFQRGILRHEDRLRGGRRRLAGEIGELGAGRLGEHRHGIGDIRRQVDVADIQRFEQRQAAGEFVPADLDALLGEFAFERALGFHYGEQGRGFLETDTQGGFSLRADGGEQRCGSGDTDGEAAQEAIAGHGLLLRGNGCRLLSEDGPRDVYKWVSGGPVKRRLQL
ncbi:hypothetical protein FQZ97_990030 [compost metagenome]